MFTHLLYTAVLAGMTLGSSTARAKADVLAQARRPATRPDVSMTGIDNALAEINGAQKEDDAARLELIKAQAQLSSVVIRLRGDLETSSDVVEAIKAWYTARARYADLARPILDSLVQRPYYRDAAAALRQAQQNAAHVRSRAGATTEERIAADEAVLAAKTALAKLENDALSADVAVGESRQAYLDAARHLRDLRAQAVRSMQQHPQYLAAKQAVDDARETLTVADERLEAVLDRAAGQTAVGQGASGLTSSQEGSDPP